MTRRIALISEHASPLAILGGADSGGQNVYVGQVARHLAAMGYEVDVFTRRDSRLLPEVARWIRGVRIFHIPAGPPEYVRKEELFPYMGRFTECVLRLCTRRQRGYDLVHANFWMSALVASDIKRELAVPFVVTFHALGRVRRAFQGVADQFPDVRFDVEDRVVREADHIIAECPQDEDDLIRYYNADPSRLSIIPCGFDPAEFWPLSKPLARVMLGFGTEERLVLQLGRMVRRKGVDNAIRGFARFQQCDPAPARLLVVGGESDEPDPEITPEIGRLKQVAEAEGVADRVTFVGRRGRDVLKYYYSAADVFVTTPWYEPFGITPVEAMACGTPVVGSDVGGVKFTVRDSETGYLVPPDDPEALGERLSQLFRHPSLRGVFGRRAVRRANDLFTWQRVANALAAVYEQVMVASHPRRPNEAERLAILDRNFEGAIRTLEESQRHLRTGVLEAADIVGSAVQHRAKVLACGNGGSAADAQHLAAEFVGRFRSLDRAPLPALALTTDTAILTALANDIGYDRVFAEQVEALGEPGDVLIGISTSGRSRNVVEAFKVARRRGLRRVAIVGSNGGELRRLADVSIIVPSTDTQHIQEVHIVVIHLLCELVEEQLVSQSSAEMPAARPPAVSHPFVRKVADEEVRRTPG
ncbi:MAG: glycosyltransferase [Chloroflexi bacterium]|nr:glycosyltransferase [Chloroflexota bacterium]